MGWGSGVLLCTMKVSGNTLFFCILYRLERRMVYLPKLKLGNISDDF
jgi:hypothetical protein